MLSGLNDKQVLELKSAILNECRRLMAEKLDKLLSSLNEVSESSNSDSKSSAGDKHETTKAMMQIEQEKLSKQIAEAKTQKTAGAARLVYGQTRSDDWARKTPYLSAGEGNRALQ